MRKVLLILLFLGQNVFCQEYHFDYFLEYKEANNGSSSFHLINTSNSSYVLNILHGSQTKYGKIKDLNGKVSHEYEVTDKKNGLTFSYLYSHKHNLESDINKDFCDITEKKVDSTKKEISIVFFKNKKKNKIEFKIEITVENSEEQFCNELLNFYTHGKFSESHLKIEKGTITTIKFERSTGHKATYNLIKKERINTLLSISEEQIQYK